MLFLPKVRNHRLQEHFRVKSYCTSLQRMLQQQQGFRAAVLLWEEGLGSSADSIYMNWSHGVLLCKATQSPRVSLKRRDQLQKHKLLPFTTQGASTPTTCITTITVAAVEWLWCWSDTEVEFQFISVEVTDTESAWIWSIKHSVRKMMKGQWWLSTMDRQ